MASWRSAVGLAIERSEMLLLAGVGMEQPWVICLQTRVSFAKDYSPTSVSTGDTVRRGGNRQGAWLSAMMTAADPRAYDCMAQI